MGVFAHLRDEVLRKASNPVVTIIGQSDQENSTENSGEKDQGK
jgi:hypothetical protein